MANVDTSELRRMAGPAYLVASMLVVIPAVDLLSNMVPLRVGDPAWRYGTLGLGSGFMLTPLLGMSEVVRMFLTEQDTAEMIK